MGISEKIKNKKVLGIAGGAIAITALLMLIGPPKKKQQMTTSLSSNGTKAENVTPKMPPPMPVTKRKEEKNITETGRKKIKGERVNPVAFVPPSSPPITKPESGNQSRQPVKENPIPPQQFPSPPEENSSVGIPSRKDKEAIQKNNPTAGGLPNPAQETVESIGQKRIGEERARPLQSHPIESEKFKKETIPPMQQEYFPNSPSPSIVSSPKYKIGSNEVIYEGEHYYKGDWIPYGKGYAQILEITPAEVRIIYRGRVIIIRKNY